MDSFSHAGLSFDVRDTGSGTAGTAVLLHGFPQDSSTWDEVTPRLAQAGLRVLAPDQRGYSPGARPEERSAYAMGQLVADVLAMLDAADVESAHVVGHDWGGVVAWGLAGRHPDRVGSVTSVSTPHPAALQAALLRSSQGLRSSYVGWIQLPVLPETVLLAGGGMVLRRVLSSSGLPAPFVDRYVARMREPGALRGALAWYRALPVAGGYTPGRVKVQATLVAGRRDPAFSSAAVRGTDRFVDGRLRLLELDAGHWLPETRAADVADAVLHQVRAARA